MTYYSQYKQDETLNVGIFKNAKNGIFVDIGAHDGECFSNTLFFEKELNWSGLCIEPNPNTFKLLESNRSCVCLNLAVYNTTGTIQFQQNIGRTEMLSGIVEQYNSEHIERIKRENLQYGGESSVIEVNCEPLSSILESNNISTIDYLSIDTEGSELSILKTLDFNLVKVNVIDIEVNYQSEADSIIELLTNNNFNLVGQLGCDFVFVNKELAFSYDQGTIQYAK
jgi:FkbM family methyltransferase